MSPNFLEILSPENQRATPASLTFLFTFFHNLLSPCSVVWGLSAKQNSLKTIFPAKNISRQMFPENTFAVKPHLSQMPFEACLRELSPPVWLRLPAISSNARPTQRTTHGNQLEEKKRVTKKETKNSSGKRLPVGPPAKELTLGARELPRRWSW